MTDKAVKAVTNACRDLSDDIKEELVAAIMASHLVEYGFNHQRRMPADIREQERHWLRQRAGLE